MRFTPPNRHTRTRGAEPVPMTSMIDVVFLLLIFFLVTASFSANEEKLSSTVQREGQGGTPSDLQPQILTVSAPGGRPVFTIGSRSITSRNELVEVLRALSTEQGIIIRAEDSAPIAAVATAMQAAVDAGHTKRTYAGTTR